MNSYQVNTWQTTEPVDRFVSGLKVGYIPPWVLEAPESLRSVGQRTGVLDKESEA